MTSVVGFYTEDKPFVESYSPRRSQRTLSKLWIRSRLDLRRRPKKISKAPCMFCEESFGKILKMREMSSFSRTGRSTNSIDWNESCDKHAVYLRRWLQWRAMFWRFGNDAIRVFIHAYSIQKQMVEYYTKSKYPGEYSTFDKVGRGAKAKSSKVSELTC